MSFMAPKASRREARDASRQRLLDAAAEVFSQKGFTAAKATDIAERAGVAVGTLYLHFRDKDGIALAVALDALNDLRARLRAAVESPGMTAENAARAHAAALVDFVSSPGSQGRLLFASDAPGLRREILDVMAEAQEAHLRERGKEGFFRTDIDPVVAAQALIGMQSQVLMWWMANPEKATSRKVIDTLAKLRLSGIHNPHPPSKPAARRSSSPKKPSRRRSQ